MTFLLNIPKSLDALAYGLGLGTSEFIHEEVPSCIKDGRSGTKCPASGYGLWS